MIPTSDDRPDAAYWNTAVRNRETLNALELSRLSFEMGMYSKRRFVLGRRFKLVVPLWGYPKGHGCTVISVWPNTQVVWDKHSKFGYSAATMSFELDKNLEFVSDRP